MNTLHTQIRAASLAALTALVSACQPSSSVGTIDFAESADTGSSGMTVAPPSALLNARNVDRDALSPFVFLNDGSIIPMTKGEDELWSGQVLVAPDTTYRLTIEWREDLQGRLLPLATHSRDVFVGVDGEVVQDIAATQYSTNIDTDSDSITNLDEREDGTDPFTFNTITPNEIEPPITPITPITPVTPTIPPAIPSIPPVVPTIPPVVPSTPPAVPTIPPVILDPEPIDEDEDAEIDLEDATVIIPRISAADAPDIDGLGVAELARDGSLLGEWADAVQFDINGDPLSVNQLMIDNGADEDNGDPHRRWAAMHDGTRMYVLVLVDDVGLRFGDSGIRPWADDSVELYIDGDNSKLRTWGDDDDFQYIIPVVTANGDANLSDDNGGRFILARQSSIIDIDLEFATGPGIGPDGIQARRFEQDVYELSFNMEDAGIELGESVGFELQINDDDDGDEREAKWGWFHPARTNTDTDTTFQDPSVMGTIVFE